jgi:ribosomal protein S18 acetylase RimI-like enzyme
MLEDLSMQSAPETAAHQVGSPQDSKSDISVRPADACDEEAVLRIVREVVNEGTSYFYVPDISDDELLAYWLPEEPSTFVGIRYGEILGAYVLRTNFPGRGEHVANASYAVAARARGTGIGSVLAEHSLHEARRRGYTAMQFNRVVSTNEGAVRLWQRAGFQIVGTLPRVFNHPTLGLVDAYVMHRFL